jgi:hypothetical protein
LYYVLGNEIITTKEKEIDVSIIPNGIYFLKAETSEGVLTRKILVQH